MKKLIAFTAPLIVCAGPVLAEADRPDRTCGHVSETTGSLSGDPRSLHLPGERSDRVEVTPPEESWQELAQEDVERRRQEVLACGVD